MAARKSHVSRPAASAPEVAKPTATPRIGSPSTSGTHARGSSVGHGEYVVCVDDGRSVGGGNVASGRGAFVVVVTTAACATS